jgi:hypothetical protein
LRQSLVVCLLLGWPLASIGGQPRPGNPLRPSVRRAAEAILVTELRRWVGYLASDVLLGRKTPLPGADSAVAYLRRNLPKLGLKPGGQNGEWFQRIPVVVRRLDPSRSFLELNGERLPFAEYARLAAGPPPRDTTITASLVYAGNGWIIPARQPNPYEGIDVHGRIVVIATDSALPPSGKPPARDLGVENRDWFRPGRHVFPRGARAILSTPSRAQFDQWSSEANAHEARWDYASAARAWPFRPVVVGSPALFTKLFAGEAVSGDSLIRRGLAGNPAHQFALKGSLTIHFAGSTDSTSAANLLALVPGRDSLLRNEYVIVGAHYDGQGVTAPVAGDSILNSADDNASGSAALLAIAKAFATGPRPRRSVLFAWWAGEEGHTLGSGHFIRNPVVPTGSQIAYVNLDMVGRTTRLTNSRAGVHPCRRGVWPPEGKGTPGTLYGPDELDVASSSTLLDNISRNVNASYLCMQWNYRAIGGASDELDASVPVIFFEEGNSDAHGLGDTADKLDYRKLGRVAKSVYAVVWEIANALERPKQDKPRP